MLTVISPAKRLDFESKMAAFITPDFVKQPRLLPDIKKLAQETKKLKVHEIKDLMGLSDNLAALNFNRFQDFKTPFTLLNARPALQAFQGDVYLGLDAKTLNKEGLVFAQDHLRILSGFYGVLRPLDLIQAYRLEMGVKFKNPRGGNLYTWWGAELSKVINKDLKVQNSEILINLASNEYWKAVDQKTLKARVITPQFKEEKNGVFKTLSFFAKKARGLMFRYMIDYKIDDPESLKNFSSEGYSYHPGLSEGDKWTFIRPQPAPKT